MNAEPSAKSYAIRRVDREDARTHGWIVRLQRADQSWTKFFSDNPYGGRVGSLKAATAYRDEVLEKNLPPTRAQYANVLRSNNRSGVPGVCRYVERRVRGKKIIENAYWIAFWPPVNGKVSRRKFSEDRYGREGAFRRAVAARHRALKELPGLFVRAAGLRAWFKDRQLQIENVPADKFHPPIAKGKTRAKVTAAKKRRKARLPGSQRR